MLYDDLIQLITVALSSNAASLLMSLQKTNFERAISDYLYGRNCLFSQAHKDTIIFVHKVFGEAADELRDIIPPEAMHSRYAAGLQLSARLRTR
jgi:hypothetical protein